MRGPAGHVKTDHSPTVSLHSIKETPLVSRCRLAAIAHRGGEGQGGDNRPLATCSTELDRCQVATAFTASLTASPRSLVKDDFLWFPLVLNTQSIAKDPLRAVLL